MTELTVETRRMIALARGADDPPPSAERAVRDRLIAQLGLAALAGAATSAAASVATDAAGVAGALSSGAPATAAAGTAAANVATAGATTALVKTVAGLILVAGLGTGAMQNDAVAERVREWPAEAAVETKEIAQRVWQFVTGQHETYDGVGSSKKPLEPSLGFDARRHALLMAIARRPDHPVAKEAELVLILGAEEALSAGDPSLAARYLDQHEMRFAGGALGDNREALRVLVDCARGEAEKAQAAALQFTRKFPTSDQVERLRSCPFAAPVVEAEAPPAAAPRSPDKPNL